ncbi:MAG: ABC transporter permease [Anaerolineales bacterium]|nr:ABC transporter permease [Anaerolineales bacterium]
MAANTQIANDSNMTRGFVLGRKDMIVTTFILLMGIIFIVLGGYSAQAGDYSRFTDQMLGTLFSLPSQATLYSVGVICFFIGGLRLYRGLNSIRSLLSWSLAFLAAFAFMVWMTSGTSLNLTGMIQSTLTAATPLTFGAMAGIFCERSGIINIAIEGMMLWGAFSAVAFASIFNNMWMGLLCASIVGGLMAALHAVLSIKYKVDQIISGTVINILAAGGTRFLNLRLLEPAGMSTPGHFQNIRIPLLADIPIVGSIFFDDQPTVFIMLILVVVVNYIIFFTPWGLRMRACGEHPRAADTVGVHVNKMRYVSVIIGGLIAGLGGAYFSLGAVGAFEDNMTRGQGFVALAAMIFGNWNPTGSFLAALLFGFADALQVKMQILKPVLPFVNISIPPEFLQMAPYILTIIVVAGVVGRAIAPAAEGKPYEKQ